MPGIRGRDALFSIQCLRGRHRPRRRHPPDRQRRQRTAPRGRHPQRIASGVVQRHRQWIRRIRRLARRRRPHRRLADPQHQRGCLPVPGAHQRRAAILRTRPAMRELTERQPVPQHGPVDGGSALARADRRRRRGQPDDRLQRHDHHERAPASRRQRIPQRPRAACRQRRPLRGGGVGTRRQRQAPAAGRHLRQARYGQGRAALRHRPDPWRQRHHQNDRRPQQRGDQHLRGDGAGWLAHLQGAGGPGPQSRIFLHRYSNDPGPSATATAAIKIRPRIKLRITPRLSSNRHSIHWTGTVAGGPYPPQGVTLDVEVKEGRKWRIFGEVVANRKGRFRYRYRFHATEEPSTYIFRVALPHSGSGGYPFTPGASNTVGVHVNP